MRLRAAHRLFLSYLAIIATVIAALSAGADSLMRRELVQTAEGDLRRELALGGALLAARPGADADSVADALGALTDRRVTIVAPDGTVIGESTRARSELAALENHRDRPEVRGALAGMVEASARYSETTGVEHLYLASPAAGGTVLRFAVPLTEIDAAVGRAQRGILGVGGIALVLAAFFSLGFSVAVTRPLRRVRSVATAMAAGDLSLRLRERRRDELGELADSLDTLADELEKRLVQLDRERVEMQTLIDSMAEGVLAVSASGALRRANPAARKMFALGRDARGIPPEAVARRPEFLRLVERALAGETVPPTALPGGRRSLLGTAHPLPDGGAVLVFLDVSELRRLEGVRRDFVANASHELKTPLTAIRGYSETLLDPDLPPELARRFAGVVKDNADRLQRIVDDLLDLSRIESGGWRIEPEPLAVDAVVAEAWSPCLAAAEEKRIRFERELDPDAARIFADPGAVRQVLANLFGNALRYSPAEGTITVRARRDGALVHLEVADTGSGIPTVHLGRVFERFYRADPARSRAEGGTGLGLAIVKHLVEAHGGRVWAESAVGQGTTIHLVLPAAPEATGA